MIPTLVVGSIRVICLMIVELEVISDVEMQLILDFKIVSILSIVVSTIIVSPHGSVYFDEKLYKIATWSLEERNCYIDRAWIGSYVEFLISINESAPMILNSNVESTLLPMIELVL